jgi:hypothetical protein
LRDKGASPLTTRTEREGDRAANVVSAERRLERSVQDAADLRPLDRLPGSLLAAAGDLAFVSARRTQSPATSCLCERHLSPNKILITHGAPRRRGFLGYQISIGHAYHKTPTIAGRSTGRSHSGSPAT